MSNIEAKILEVTAAKGKKKSEDRQDYLRRLVTTVQRRSDDEDTGDKFWDSLMDDEVGETVQNWVNIGIKAINAEREAAKEEDRKENPVEMEEFPDFETEDDESEVETEKPAKKGKANTEAKEKPAKAEKVAKSNGAEKPAKKVAAAKAEKPAKKTVGAYSLIHKFLVENPNGTVDEINEFLLKKDRNLSKNAISTVRSLGRGQLKAAKELGKLRGVDIQ